MKPAWLLIFLLAGSALHAQESSWAPTKDTSKDAVLNGRATETFEAGVKPEWGYAAPQQDTFVVMHPKEDRNNAPLYVVLHSAGHDVMSCVSCTKTVGNHDIYRSPDDHYALYVDCRKHQALDWWWGGMHGKDQGLIKRNSGGETMPVEKRVIDTVKWVIKMYDIVKSTVAGQVNAFFRWKNVSDSAEKFETSLFLVSPAELKTQFEIPKEATADVTLRRVQRFHLKPGASFRWTYGAAKGEGQADSQGVITIPALKITAEPANLSVMSK